MKKYEVALKFLGGAKSIIESEERQAAHDCECGKVDERATEKILNRIRARREDIESAIALLSTQEEQK